MSRAYAENTRVPESKSRSEIEDMLRRHGCDRIGIVTEATGVWFAFTNEGRSYRMGIELPIEGSPKDAQARRQKLRVLGLYIKARLHAVRDGIKNFEQEFMPEVVMQGGQTMLECYVQQLPELQGRMPSQLMLPPPPTR